MGRRVKIVKIISDCMRCDEVVSDGVNPEWCGITEDQVAVLNNDEWTCPIPEGCPLEDA